MGFCPHCGQENRDDARFCVNCGTALQAARQETQTAPPYPSPPGGAAEPPPPPPGPAAPPEAAVPPYAPTGTAATTPPGTATPAAPGAAYRPAVGVAYPARAASGTGKRKPVFWVGACVLVLAGLLVLISSFLPWISGPFGFGSVSGMDFVTKEQFRMDNLFFDYGNGYPFFSGLVSLILGVLLAFLAVVLLASRRKWPAGLALPFCIISLGVAITNLSSILRGPGGADMISAGSGIYVFIIFSLLGLVGSIMSLAG